MIHMPFFKAFLKTNLILGISLFQPLRASDYPVPKGSYQGPCGQLYSDEYFNNLLNFDYRKISRIERRIPLQDSELLIYFNREVYVFTLVSANKMTKERSLLSKCNCHGQDMSFSFDRLDGKDEISVGLFMMKGGTIDWSWGKNIQPHIRYIRKEQYESGRIILKEFTFDMRNAGNWAKAQEAATETPISSKYSWLMNPRLIPQEYNTGFFCPGPTLEKIKNALSE